MNVEWGTAIVLDFFFGGMAVGTFLFSVIYGYFHPDTGIRKETARYAAYLSPIFMAVAMFFLLLHLGRPFRSSWAFIFFNPTSAIAWGALFQFLFTVGIVLYALMTYAESRGENPRFPLPGFLNNPELRRKVGWFGLPNAVIVGINHGLLLFTFESRPLWNNAATAFISIVSVVTTGLAVIFLVLALRGRLQEQLTTLTTARVILVGALVAQFLNVILWITTLLSGPFESYNAVIRFLSEQIVSFWILAVLLGLAAPIYLGMRDLLEQKKTGQPVFRGAPVFTLIVLAGAFFLRYSLVIAGQFR